MKRIAALVPNTLGVAPGQRVRIESWSKYLQAAGWAVDFYPFESEELHKILYERDRTFAKTSRIVGCYINQLGRVLRGLQ